MRELRELCGDGSGFAADFRQEDPGGITVSLSEIRMPEAVAALLRALRSRTGFARVVVETECAGMVELFLQCGFRQIRADRWCSSSGRGFLPFACGNGIECRTVHRVSPLSECHAVLAQGKWRCCAEKYCVYRGVVAGGLQLSCEMSAEYGCNRRSGRRGVSERISDRVCIA